VNSNGLSALLPAVSDFAKAVSRESDPGHFTELLVGSVLSALIVLAGKAKERFTTTNVTKGDLRYI
jgi:hypothetical protein